MTERLGVPFFRTPGNHDIANATAQEVYRDRYGASRYSFVYNDTLFLVLDSEDPPREAPAGIKEKLDLYTKLQTEDPEAANALMQDFLSDESVVAGLAASVEFDEAQTAFIEGALADNPVVR